MLAQVRPAGDRTGSARSALSTVAVVAFVVVVPVGLALTVEEYGYDIWGAFIWAPVLLALCLPLTRWVTRRTAEPSIAGFLMAVAFLKIVVGPILRYSSAQAFYGGLTDAARYDNEGTTLAVQFRDLNFGGLGKVSGTRFLEVVSGLVQAVIGESRFGVFLVFSFFGFVGLLLLYVAFCEALPAGDKRLYRWLLFLTPTIWYWPSSIGKEAVMLLCLGAAAFGAVRLLAGRLSGLVVGGLGLWGVIVIRPHMALVFMVGVLFAIPALQRRADRAHRPLSVRLAPLLLLLALPFAVGAVEDFFGLDELNPDSAQDVAAKVEERTSQGGSEYETTNAFTPYGLVLGTVTTLSRPFPWEASGAQGLMSALEMAVLGIACTTALWRRRGGLLAGLRQRYTRFAVGYTLAFCMAFATVGNFGILTRQRSLVLPFAFVVVACVGVTGPTRRPTPVSSETPARALDLKASAG